MDINQLYRSPKRKRSSDPNQYSPIVSPTLPRITTNLQEFPFAEATAVSDPVDRAGDGSPRTCVAVQLHGLDLEQDAMGDVRYTSKRLAPMSAGSGGPLVGYQYPTLHAHSVNLEPPAPSLTQASMEPSTSKVSRYGNATFTFEAGELPSPNIQQSLSGRKSPPLHGNPEDNPLTWHASEITGHDPTDSNDDGYGVNGIGYKPTAAQAWARSQKRKQQLAEYKSREAREARQRRSERRRMESRDASPDEEPGEGKKKAVKVRFEEV